MKSAKSALRLLDIFQQFKQIVTTTYLIISNNTKKM